MMGVVLSMAALGCISEAERAERTAEIRDRVQTDASAASSCAEELHTIGDRDPMLVATALELQDFPVAAVVSDLAANTALGFSVRRLTRSEAAERTRREIARRAAIIAADLVLVGDGSLSGPEALDRAFRAGEQARQVRDRLCQARDVATTLTAMAHTASRAEETASIRQARTSISRGAAARVVSHEQ